MNRKLFIISNLRIILCILLVYSNNSHVLFSSLLRKVYSTFTSAQILKFSKLQCIWRKQRLSGRRRFLEITLFSFLYTKIYFTYSRPGSVWVLNPIYLVWKNFLCPNLFFIKRIYMFLNQNPQSTGTLSISYMVFQSAKICSKKLRVWTKMLLVRTNALNKFLLRAMKYIYKAFKNWL